MAARHAVRGPERMGCLAAHCRSCARELPCGRRGRRRGLGERALGPARAQVYIVGEVGIQEELDLKGIAHIGGPEDAGKTISLKPGFALPHDPDARPAPAHVLPAPPRGLPCVRVQRRALCEQGTCRRSEVGAGTRLPA